MLNMTPKLQCPLKISSEEQYIAIVREWIKLRHIQKFGYGDPASEFAQTELPVEGKDFVLTDKFFSMHSNKNDAPKVVDESFDWTDCSVENVYTMLKNDGWKLSEKIESDKWCSLYKYHDNDLKVAVDLSGGIGFNTLEELQAKVNRQLNKAYHVLILQSVKAPGFYTNECFKEFKHILGLGVAYNTYETQQFLRNNNFTLYSDT